MSAGRSRARAWRLPLIAGLTTLAVTVTAFLLVWPYLNRSSTKPGPAVPAARKQLDQFIDEGRRALADGTFPLALEKFRAAVELRQRSPDLLDSTENRRLNQLYWQSDVLARLVEPTLKQLIKKANDCDTEAGWQAMCRLKYRGNWIVFDEVVERRQGQPVMRQGAEVRANRVRGRVALGDLTLLGQLPLEPPQRWLFAARLASVTRDGEEWVVHLEPDSGILLTDADAVTAWNPALRKDPQLGEVLERQAKLSRQLLMPEP
jgi:hypothetical protein